MRSIAIRIVAFLCAVSPAILAEAAYIASSIASVGTVQQGSYSPVAVTTINLYGAAYYGTDWKQDFLWMSNETVPAPSGTWTYGDGGTSSAGYYYPRVWGQPITSTGYHAYYVPGTYTVSVSGNVNVAYVNTDSSYWMPGLGIVQFPFSNSTTVTVQNVVPQNAVVYQNGSSSAITVNEGSSITREVALHG